MRTLCSPDGRPDNYRGCRTESRYRPAKCHEMPLQISRNQLAWQEKKCLDETQNALYGKAEDAEWQQYEPNKRIENEQDEGEWPAENEEYKPE